MSKCKSLLLFCGLLFFGVASAHTQQVPSTIFTDPAPDKEFPADVAAPDVMSHGARLNAVLYIASGHEPHAVVILVPGFPGNEKNLDLAYSLRRAGWNVLLAHFRGSWGSEGTFSFSNAIRDMQAAILFLRDAENVKKYRIDPKKIVLIGHSMGGFMAACAAAGDPEVAGLVMILQQGHEGSAAKSRKYPSNGDLCGNRPLLLRPPHRPTGRCAGMAANCACALC